MRGGFSDRLRMVLGLTLHCATCVGGQKYRVTHRPLSRHKLPGRFVRGTVQRAGLQIAQRPFRAVQWSVGPLKGPPAGEATRISTEARALRTTPRASSGTGDRFAVWGRGGKGRGVKVNVLLVLAYTYYRGEELLEYFWVGLFLPASELSIARTRLEWHH